MRTQIDHLLTRLGGVASRSALLSVLSRNELDDEIARRRLVAPFPRAYCRPWEVDDEAVRDRAALVSVGQPAALSHVTGLRCWGIVVPASDRLHVTVPVRRHPIGRRPGLVVHRTRVPTPVRRVNGLVVVSPAAAVVRSWPLLHGPERRAPAIEAVRRRLATTDELHRAVACAPGMSGQGQLLGLIAHLAAGCESELELWGYLTVFDVPGLRHGVRQKVFDVNGARYRADLAYERERVVVELDGHAFHSTRAQRERDMRRDAALASIGWLTLRFSHERLHRDVDGCRRDTLAVLAARRRVAT